MKITWLYEGERVTIESGNNDVASALQRVIDAVGNDPENVTVHCIDGLYQYSGTQKELMDSGKDPFGFRNN